MRRSSSEVNRRRRIAVGMYEMGIPPDIINKELGYSELSNGGGAAKQMSNGWNGFKSYCEMLRTRGKNILTRLFREHADQLKAAKIMNLYLWRSEYLENYAPGYIAVMAPNVEQARVKALAAFVEHITAWFEEVCIDEPEDRNNVYAMKEKAFKADIAKEPTIVSNGVLLIKGSD